MRTLPVSRINTTINSYKLPSVSKKVNQQVQSRLSFIINKPSSALIIAGLPTILHCGDEEDNYGYGDPDWMKKQREDSERERERRYYGYDTPGLGSGSREVDWEN